MRRAFDAARRFPTLVNNIRTRRGEKVCMHIPVYRDTHTGDTRLPKSVMEHQRRADGSVIELRDLYGKKVEEEVYMDCMAFGMGMCCLQITFQAWDVNEARDLYDQLAVVSPLFMAISAATPMVKGWLLDTDTRWDTISGSVDCRTPFERGLATPPPGEPVHRQLKSRYSSISLFISNSHDVAQYNDVHAPIDQESFDRLTAAGTAARWCQFFLL